MITIKLAPLAERDRQPVLMAADDCTIEHLYHITRPKRTWS